jgi:hypothetical protein
LLILRDDPTRIGYLDDKEGDIGYRVGNLTLLQNRLSDGVHHDRDPLTALTG